MRLQELLDKFSNANFLLTIDGWCDEIPFCEYENEKNQEYWNKYKDRKVKSLAILRSNDKPELSIALEE